jgi:hypothetical protein
VRPRQEDGEFKASQTYIARLCLKENLIKKWAGGVAQVVGCISNKHEALGLIIIKRSHRG